MTSTQQTELRYFFDVDDGSGLVKDQIGLELNTLNDVRTEAIKALPAIAREVMPNGDHRTLRTIVRDQNGRQIFQASLALEARWL